MTTCRVAGTLGAALALLVSACGGEQRPPTKVGSTADALHAILLDDLRAQTAGSIYPAKVDTSRVTYEVDTSRVVPGLRYVRAAAHPAGFVHGGAISVAGARGRRQRILHGTADWAWVAAGWVAPDAASAARACLEIVQSVREQDDPRPRVAYYDAAQARDDYLTGDSAALRRRVRVPLAVDHAPEGWRVRGWVVNPDVTSIAVEYECRLPTGTAATDTVSLVAVDSVPHSLVRRRFGSRPPRAAATQ